MAFSSLLPWWQIRCPLCHVPRNSPLRGSSCILSPRLHSTRRHWCRQLVSQSATRLRSLTPCFFSPSVARPDSYAARDDKLGLLPSCVKDYFCVPGISYMCHLLSRVPSHDSVQRSCLLSQVTVLCHHDHLRLEHLQTCTTRPLEFRSH